ncbi:macrophage mannose receptor 1 [Elysia marginata]|uniref:Macrophage mannose receptor 1 n=1 Tax=Elysia marginata TaxID=1093978 RepID=A0AAV4J250_9GAST|nr:macrophage mannose receptor 1 [Elysia marginata]
MANVCESWAAGAMYAGRGMCFILNPTPMNITDAQDLCLAEFGGHVAELRTEYQRQTVISLRDAYAVHNVWLGASDEPVEKEWRWLSDNDHANLPRDWWRPGQPNNEGGEAHCLVMSSSSLLFDRRCFLPYATTCQKYIDNPCDELLPGAEYYNGSCFKAVAENMTIDAAQERCEDMGAFLAEPYSADLKEFLMMFAGMNFSPDVNIVFGLTKTPLEENFRWLSTGDPVNATNWQIKTSANVSNKNSSTVAMMTGSSNWQWTEESDEVQAHVICQKVIPVYNTIYLAALPSSSLSVTNSALLSYAYSQPGWITVEMTFNPEGQVVQKNFLGQEGLQYRMALDTDKRSLLVRSTQLLHMTLTLWHHDLTAISSSLLLPVFLSDMSESRLTYPSPGDVSIGISSSGDSTVPLDIAVSGGESKATFSVGEFRYNLWPWVTFSARLTDQSQPFYIDSLTGYTRGPFVHANQALAVFTTERKPLASRSDDVTFEHVLSISQIGTSYVTFPSMPFNKKVKDTFTVVAVYNDTRIAVPSYDTSLEIYNIILDKAGDTFDLKLYANGFRHVTGSKPFYLYARLGGTGGNNSCTVTLLADHLWTGQYIVHLAKPWTLLPYVYVLVVGRNPDMVTVNLENSDSSQIITPMDCHNVKGTSYEACYFRLSSTTVGPYSLTRPSGEKFAAYMFGSKGQAAACHQLGMNFTATSGGHQDLVASIYLSLAKEFTLNL